MFFRIIVGDPRLVWTGIVSIENPVLIAVTRNARTTVLLPSFARNAGNRGTSIMTVDDTVAVFVATWWTAVLFLIGAVQQFLQQFPRLSPA